MNIQSVEFKPVDVDKNGAQIVIRFNNGWGASIIKHRYSYGSNQGKWELAVIDSDNKINYSNPITDDVLGHLTEDEINDYLEIISSWT